MSTNAPRPWPPPRMPWPVAPPLPHDHVAHPQRPPFAWQPPPPPFMLPQAPPAPPVRLRCSDADRNRVLEQLQVHHADGRLRLDEYEQRVEAALAATYVDELPPLLADLPPVPSRRLPSAKRRRHFCVDRVVATGVLVALVTVLWVIAFVDPQEGARLAVLGASTFPLTVLFALVLGLPCPRHPKRRET